MADGVDAAVKAVQKAAAATRVDGALVEPRPSELRHRHDSVLLRRDLRDLLISWGAKVPHCGTKAPGTADSPPGHG